MRVQVALYARGYYNGSIDGVIGPETKSAIANYQSNKFLSVTGSLTDELIKHLDTPIN